MKISLALLGLAASLFVSTAATAQAPSAAPPGSTGLCKDGSYTSNEKKKGACSGHKGVQDWYVGQDATANKTAKKPSTADAAAPAPAPATASTKPAAAATKTAAVPAPGGGPGQVWVNTNSKVYHCSGTKYYGKTKQGEYMTEAAAKTAGNHADHGKSCSS